MPIRGDYKDVQGGRHRVPDLEAEENEILGYRDRHFNFYSVYRNRHMERAAKALHYYIGHQWIELDREVLLDTSRGYVFRDSRSRGDVEMPRPVTNFCGPAADSELATLNKRKLTPKCSPSERHPRTEAAAKIAQEVLDHRLRKLDWSYHRDTFILDTITTGTGCLKSYWDTPYDELTRIGNPEAMVCPECEAKFATNNIPTSIRESDPRVLSSALLESPDDDVTSFQFSRCPFCRSAPQLSPFPVTPDLAENGVDAFHRPLGFDAPRGNTAIEVPSMFYLFPENSGLDVTPATCRVHGQASIRSMDWLAERYPDRIDEIEPGDPQDLMEQHPIMGERHLLGWYNSSLDSAIYEDHQRVYEIYADRSYRFPEGRSIVIAGGKTILEDGPLYRTFEGEDGEKISVPRVKYFYSRFKIRKGELWGQSLLDDLISPQNRINAIDSQVIEARERMGSPNLLIEEQMELTGPEWDENYGGGKLMTYVGNPALPGSKPEVFGSTLMPSGVFEERGSCKEDLQFLGGPQPIQTGAAPKNVSTTSGLQLLGEQAELISEPKLRDIETACQGTWEHQLELVWVLRTDSDEYEVDTEAEGYLVKQYTREDIAGQTKVKVEKQAFIEKSIYDREAAREAQADGLYMVEDPVSRKRLLEIRGLPTDINQNQNLQVESAKRQWVEFTDDGRIPVIDETLDDPIIRYEILGTYLQTNEGKRLSDAVGWPQILKSIGGWQMELIQAEQADMVARQYYGPELSANKPLADQKYAADMLNYTAAVEQFQLDQARFEQESQAQIDQQQALQERTQQVQADIAALPPEAQPAAMAQLQADLPPPPEPLQPPVLTTTPPPPPLFMPVNKEDRVFVVWQRMLERIPVPQPSEERNVFLRFRAVVEAYKLFTQVPPGAEAMQAQQMMGTGTPPAPPNPVNPPNVPSPGTGEALANAGAV